MKVFARIFFALLCIVPLAHAHVGSKDVFENVHAGPYTLYVTVRPPNVIPGITTVEVRSTGAPISSLRVAPLPVTGEASKHPPTPDLMQASTADPAFYTGSVWIMSSGTWQVRFEIDGPSGHQVTSVPVVAVPISVLTMPKGMGTILTLLGLFLVVSMAGIVAASFGEARLQPGTVTPPTLRRRALIATSVSVVLMLLIVVLAGKWWNVEAADYSDHVYKSLPLNAILSGSRLDLIPTPPVAPKYKSATPQPPVTYLLDHGKVMHLYAIREPQMDAAFHLHPTLVAGGDFRTTLPTMPPGHYQLYGDVVRASGFPETLLATIDIPASMPHTPLDSEDAEATPAPLSAGELGLSYKLPDGYTMIWDRPASLTASTAYSFRFQLLDPTGKPATEMQPYLGMAGHAAFVKTDGSAFAHTHPEGSAPMADVMLANSGMAAMPSMASPTPIAPEVSFPYGFPTPGRYRIFIQMKHAGTVETGVFDANVK